MAQKFRPLPVEQSVRRLRIDLASVGLSGSFDDVLLPEFWKDAIDIRVGDEIEVVSSAWQRTVRVTSLGPEGAAVEHLSGQPSAPRARHVVVCRERADALHMFGIYQREGGAWQRLAPGQTSLAPLVEELAGIIARDGNADITIVPWDLAKVQALFAVGDAAIAKAEILLPEGTADSDRWVWVVRDGSGEHVALRFHRRTLSEQVSEFLWYRSGCPFGAHEPDWRRLEKSWQPTGGVLLIRPSWSARSLWPACFPEPKPYPAEAEALAAAKRERDKTSRKRELSRKRQEENAQFEQRWSEQQREARQAITDKFGG